MIEIFKIDDLDFSGYVNKRAYDVNQEDETVSWKDANSVIHTTVVRTRVSGKIDLIFTTEIEHSEFVKALAAKQIDSYWHISVYVNNTHAFKTFKARIDTTAETVFGNLLVNGRPVVCRMKLNIEEA